MRALGVDLGDRRIGLAVSAGSISVPHATLERTDHPAADRYAIVSAARAAGCDTIVVGVARSLDGGDGPAAHAARAEIAALRDAATDLEVVEHDERFTTRIAEQRLRDAGVRAKRQRDRVDQSAAAVMLQSYLDQRS